ncbi:redoxin domain-containing protein [Cytobacillus sp. NJ13]|nr:redoxin domain-containing protein [Cytobacillus sp. NJ13]
MVELHQNMDKLEGMDANMYIVSNDQPEQQLELYNALEEKMGHSLPFVSDPEMKLIERADMKNGDAAYRGYALMDTKGNIVFNKVNDHWGEEIDKTAEDLKKEYEELSK